MGGASPRARRNVQLTHELPVVGMLVPIGPSDAPLRRRLLAAAAGKIFGFAPGQHPDAIATSPEEWARLLAPSRSGKLLHRLPLLYEAPSEPPRGVKAGGSLLEHRAVQISGSGDAGVQSRRGPRLSRGVRYATVSAARDHHDFAWTSPSARERAGGPCGHVQVDLGADCLVTHV
ncbi:hypothetical protein T492DRAFT_1009898, partial [Pavlovales sp. CCMP2436]